MNIESQENYIRIEPVAEDDWSEGDGGNDTLLGGEGDDFLESYGDEATLDGSAGNDTLETSGHDNVLDGGSGNDSLVSGGGNDTLLGGEGDDFLESYGDEATLDGGSGNDTIVSHGEGNTLIGGAGSDHFLVEVWENENPVIIQDYNPDEDNLHLSGFYSTVEFDGGFSVFDEADFGRDPAVIVYYDESGEVDQNDDDNNDVEDSDLLGGGVDDEIETIQETEGESHCGIDEDDGDMDFMLILLALAGLVAALAGGGAVG